MPGLVSDHGLLNEGLKIFTFRLSGFDGKAHLLEMSLSGHLDAE